MVAEILERFNGFVGLLKHFTNESVESTEWATCRSEAPSIVGILFVVTGLTPPILGAVLQELWRGKCGTCSDTNFRTAGGHTRNARKIGGVSLQAR